MNLNKKIQKYSLLSDLCAFLTAGIGLFALLGWLSNSRLVFSFSENYKPMPPNIAISLIISGILLYILNYSFVVRKLVIFVGSLFTISLAFLRLLNI